MAVLLIGMLKRMFYGFDCVDEFGPGIASPPQLASTTAADISYWITGDASAEGAYNWQMYRFQLPSSVVSRGMRQLKWIWTGHGEPTTAPTNHPTTLYLWNRTTSRWDQVASGVWGGDPDTTSGQFTSSVDPSSCLKCHGTTQPAGVVMPSSVRQIASAWNSTTGDYHGTHVGSNPHIVTSGSYSWPEFYSSGLKPGWSYGASLSCVDCHDPHGSPNQYHFVTTVGDKTGVSVPGSPQWGPLCGGCHAGDASGWHQYCEDCHHSPDSHVNPPDPAYMDCATCHAHGATWTHPVTCHCYPYERTYQTF
jgi:hypothetical protein